MTAEVVSGHSLPPGKFEYSLTGEITSLKDGDEVILFNSGVVHFVRHSSRNRSGSLCFGQERISLFDVSEQGGKRGGLRLIEFVAELFHLNFRELRKSDISTVYTFYK